MVLVDETVEDDPFRVILFADIEDFLFILPEGHTSRELLLEAYLLFCHNSHLDLKADDWSEDAFVVGLSSSWSAQVRFYRHSKCMYTDG